MITLAAFVVVIAGLRVAQDIVTPFLLAAFFAIICYPPLAWLQRKRVPNWLALLIVIGGGILVVLLVLLLTASSMSQFAGELGTYQEKLIAQQDQLVQWLGNVEWLKEHEIDVNKYLKPDGFDPKLLVNLARFALGTLGSLSSNLVLILLIFVFILVEASVLPAKFQAMPGFTNLDGDRVRQILTDIRNYLTIKTKVSLLTAVLITGCLWMLGVDFPVLWGLLAFFCNFVPNIGSILAAIPAVLLALVQLGPMSALYVALSYLVINGLIGNVLEPRMMGQGLGLSTLVVFLSLIFWGWVLGPVGMILSVPLTMMAKITLDRFEETRWIAILLAASPPEK
jgi:predicted PurR-regulated permease PerM